MSTNDDNGKNSRHTHNMTISVERFVPQGKVSLAADAPGWHGQQQHDDNDGDDETQPQGPICWKCRGTGHKPQKTGSDEQPPPRKRICCTVCQGRGKLPAKAAQQKAAHQPGRIPASRRTPSDWIPAKPCAYALLAEKGNNNNNNDNTTTKWKDLVIQADNGQDVIMAPEDDESTKPAWLPQQGEELCKLNGSWRILQRVGGHRWTTDDCVTAYVAVRQVMQQFPQQQQLQYLDLGTGNGSVLQMVLRALLQENYNIAFAKGIEARTEAVGLARRSLLFNVGPDFPVEIVHGDFRDVVAVGNNNGGDDDGGRNGNSTSSSTLGNFDLVTGTPPYFRVDFHVKAGGQDVASAVIRQGGMPTALQSAPARCEFRGGIEAYCAAAARALVVDTGRFVVCENFLNHARVLQAAQDARLQILRIIKVQGRVGRKHLFCVYVMRKPPLDDDAARMLSKDVVEETLAVRDANGNWTKEYAESVFQTLSIPPFSPAAT